MALPVTSLYAALLTLLVLVLANLVSARRGHTGISILHGDDMGLALAIRRHGNLIENLPLALILIGLCEVADLGRAWLHLMGLVLVMARVAHVAGLSAHRPTATLRIAGGVGTQAVMLGAAGWLLWAGA